MSCELTERVSLLVDGELSPVELHEVERHLLTCAECQQTRLDFVNLRQQITAYPVLVDLVAQRRALAEILAGRVGVAPRTHGWGARLRAAFNAPRFNPAWAAAVALLIVACAVAIVVYRNTQHRTSVAVAPTNNNTRVAQPTPSTSTRAEVAVTSNNNQQQAQSTEQNNVRDKQQPAGA